MNQKQRDFLSGTITKNISARREQLKKKRLKLPSLSNYIVSAILNGTIEYQSPDTIRDTMQKLVMLLGAGESIIAGKSWRDSAYHKSLGDNSLSVPAEMIFVLPDDYKQACKAVNDYNNKIDTSMAALDAYELKMSMKIQIGSPEALESLVEEADKLVNISLMSNIIGELPSVDAVRSLGLLTGGEDGTL